MEGFLSEETRWEKAAKTRMGKYLTWVETDFIRIFGKPYINGHCDINNY
jgi:hypothetical protein